MQLADAVGAVSKAVVRAAARVVDVGGPVQLGSPLTGPGPTKRDPVVLLNGFGCDNEMWDAFASSLRRDGFDVHVAALPDKALGDIGATATWLAGLVAGIRRDSGAAKVDLVGYSEGGLIARDYVKFAGGLDAVDSVVTLGTPHHGVGVPALGALLDRFGGVRDALPVALRQMIQGSSYLVRLNAGDETPGAVRYTSILSHATDGVVWPGTSPVLEGARNVVLAPAHGRLPRLLGPNHLELTQRSNAAYEATRAALLA